MQSENMKDSVQVFKEKKFIVVKNFISPELIEVVHQYMQMKVTLVRYGWTNPRFPVLRQSMQIR